MNKDVTRKADVASRPLAMFGRLRKANRAHSHGEGMTNGSIKSYTMTAASFYTHFMDYRIDSPTYGKRVSRDAL